MDSLTINITWEWALGILITVGGALIGIAWKGSARFTAIETSMDWIKKTLDELKLTSDNQASGNPAFASHSPVSLTEIGQKWLSDSGLQQYIDTKRHELLSKCRDKQNTNPYEVQKYIFSFFDNLDLDPQFENRLKEFAFDKGTTTGVMRRVGAIYLRDMCLQEFGMERSEIDRHDPDKFTTN